MPAEEISKKEYRTKRKAVATTDTPRYIATPTLPSYQYRFSLFKAGHADLHPISHADDLPFTQGVYYFLDLPVSTP